MVGGDLLFCVPVGAALIRPIWLSLLGRRWGVSPPAVEGTGRISSFRLFLRRQNHVIAPMIAAQMRTTATDTPAILPGLWEKLLFSCWALTTVWTAAGGVVGVMVNVST